MDFSKDIGTLSSNYIRFFNCLIKEYEQVKAKQHPKYKYVKDLFASNKICQQNFHKYYKRFKRSGLDTELLPQKRGPKWRSRRTDLAIEQKVVELRSKHLNKFEIYDILLAELKEKTPSLSTIYKILKRNGVNKLPRKETGVMQEKIKIIKEKAGDLGHMDCCHLGREVINGGDKCFLLGMIDDASRIAHVELIKDIRSLTVMFATMRICNFFNSVYNIKFKEIMTDNGAEFASRTNIDNHPFERMLIETKVKHVYTKAYKPQTNGKIERFWKTLRDDLIDGTYFEDIEDFKQKLEEYLAYYNHYRKHQSLNGHTPVAFLEKSHRNM
jgi:IS30 family transposase